LADGSPFAALCPLSPSDFYHCGNVVRGHTKTAEDMVSGNVVFNESEVGR